MELMSNAYYFGDVGIKGGKMTIADKAISIQFDDTSLHAHNALIELDDGDFIIYDETYETRAIFRMHPGFSLCMVNRTDHAISLFVQETIIYG